MKYSLWRRAPERSQTQYAFALGGLAARGVSTRIRVGTRTGGTLYFSRTITSPRPTICSFSHKRYL